MKYGLGWGLALATVAALATPGCGDEDNPMDAGDTPSILVTVGSGTRPSYSWLGVGAFSVTVVRTSEPVIPVWGIVTPGTEGIESPVTHGTVPAGAVETATAEGTLATGVGYRVRVARLDDADFGFADFTP